MFHSAFRQQNMHRVTEQQTHSLRYGLYIMHKPQNTRECMINKKPEYRAGGWAGGGVNSSSCV